MNIIQAINDPHLFRDFLGDDLSSWRPWLTALRALYGLPIKKHFSRALIQQCTGRKADELPPGGFKSALFLTGRRSGKSRVSSIIGAFESLFGGHEHRLAKGESGVLPIISPSRYQSSIVWNYLKAIFSAPLLEQEIAECRDSQQQIVLRNGIEIRILTGDWRLVRGPAVVCAVVDELCFFGFTEESKVKSDHELIRALRPALMTTGGKLIGISSKYARRGYAFSTWKRYHGSNKGHTQFSPNWGVLVWDAASRVMNPTLSEAEIKKEFEEDPAAARSEWLGDWRDDVCEFIPRSIIESLIVPARKELLPSVRHAYRAGVDLSGGRRDAAALVIVHKEDGRIIQDLACDWPAPLKPQKVVGEMARVLKRFGLSSLTGDNYAGEWGAEAFRIYGIRYRQADYSKNDLYRELLPLLCGGKECIELLDNPTQTNELVGLERRPRSGGKDVIDHPRNGHDDLANALAVAVAGCVKRQRKIGAMDSGVLPGFLIDQIPMQL